MENPQQILRITDLLLAMGLGWALTGILLMLFKEKRKEPETPYAIFVLAIFSLTILDNLLRFASLSNTLAIGIIIICRPAYYLIGPSLYLYIHSLLRPGRTFKPVYLLHFVPYLIQLVLFVLHPITLFPAPAEMLRPTLQGTNSLTLLGTLSLILYCAVLFRILQNHQKDVDAAYSVKNAQVTLSWLRYLMLLYLFLSLCKLVLENLFPSLLTNNEIVSALRYIPSILFVFLFSLFSKKQSSFEEPQQKQEIPVEIKQKYSKSGMTEKEEKELYSDLLEYIQKNKPYLNPELTLAELSEQMGETRHRISEVINREAGVNFYSFINDFRLEAIKSALENNQFPNYTILAIANEFGFNSSSVFYSLFKKKYNHTPREILNRSVIVE
jgi:AraC-like DNA-binding protein